MVQKVANSLSDVFATETSVATPESYNKASNSRFVSQRIFLILLIEILVLY